MSGIGSGVDVSHKVHEGHEVFGAWTGAYTFYVHVHEGDNEYVDEYVDDSDTDSDTDGNYALLEEAGAGFYYVDRGTR